MGRSILMLGGTGRHWRPHHKVPPPQAGDAAPDFNLPDQYGKSHRLKDYAGNWLVLYFYPKDDTPGCTEEACSFRDNFNKLQALGAHILGVSVDSGRSHAAFAAKYMLPFPLLADDSTGVTARYGALLNLLVLKVAKRYTFLIDPQGMVRKVYYKVRTAHHSREIIEELKQLSGRST